MVIRSQLDEQDAELWQSKLAELGAICRVKDLGRKDSLEQRVDKHALADDRADCTLKDITAAHLECPRCGHLQLDSSHCARCGVDLEDAFKQKRKEDLMIEKKIRQLRAQQAPEPAVEQAPAPLVAETPVAPVAERGKKGLLGWLKIG